MSSRPPTVRWGWNPTFHEMYGLYKAEVFLCASCRRWGTKLKGMQESVGTEREYARVHATLGFIFLQTVIR